MGRQTGEGVCTSQSDVERLITGAAQHHQSASPVPIAQAPLGRSPPAERSAIERSSEVCAWQVGSSSCCTPGGAQCLWIHACWEEHGASVSPPYVQLDVLLSLNSVLHGCLLHFYPPDDIWDAGQACPRLWQPPPVCSSCLCLPRVISVPPRRSPPIQGAPGGGAACLPV